MNFRWLVFCHVPTYCDSLPHYDTTMVFGRTLLRAVFKYIRKQVMEQFHREKDSMPQERRLLLLTNFPPFLNQLDEEIYAANSPIWDPEFKAQSIQFQSLLDSDRLKGKMYLKKMFFFLQFKIMRFNICCNM